MVVTHRFQFSSSQGGVYSRIATYSGFVQGGTYTFDQSDHLTQDIE